jgi:sulfate permease, SulP family
VRFPLCACAPPEVDSRPEAFAIATTPHPSAADHEASWRELFTPKLVTCLREGYGFATFRADLIAGLTVAVVALPLAMALAIASGTTPDRGLFTSVIAGFLISALGGSRLQIGGPTGAFVVVVFATIERHGYDGLLLATILAGAMLVLLGLARLGTIIKYIPYPVVTGFTSGIAVIIFTSQIKSSSASSWTGCRPTSSPRSLRSAGRCPPSIPRPAASASAR